MGWLDKIAQNFRYLFIIIMRVLTILAIVSLTYAKPKIHPAVQFAGGRIIGGEEAPKRKSFGC